MDDVHNTPQKKPSQFVYILIIAGSVSFLIVTSMLIPLSIGYLLDKIFHTSPFFLSVGAIVGFFGSIVNILQLVKRMK